MDTVQKDFAAICVWCNAFIEVRAGSTIADRSAGRVLVMVNRLAHLLLSGQEGQKEADHAD